MFEQVFSSLMGLDGRQTGMYTIKITVGKRITDLGVLS